MLRVVRRTFGIDVESCSKCSGRTRLFPVGKDEPLLTRALLSRMAFMTPP